MKAINGKTFAREIDKLHGIEPALCPWIDAKVTSESQSSFPTLGRRLEALM